MESGAALQMALENGDIHPTDVVHVKGMRSSLSSARGMYQPKSATQDAARGSEAKRAQSSASGRIIFTKMQEGSILTPLTLDGARALYDPATHAYRPIQAVPFRGSSMYMKDPVPRDPRLLVMAICDGQVAVRNINGGTELSFPLCTLEINGTLAGELPYFNTYQKDEGWLQRSEPNPAANSSRAFYLMGHTKDPVVRIASDGGLLLEKGGEYFQLFA